MINTQQSPFLIYGTGGDGILTLQILVDAGASIIGFIDQRAAEIKNFHGFPVYSPQDAAQFSHQKAIVIITIKNVFAHEEVANTLHTLGFQSIIFKPLAVLKGRGSETECLLSALHDMLVVQRRWIGDGVYIPDIPPPSLCSFEDKLMVRKDNNEVTAWVPVELVFNYTNAGASFSACNMPLFFPLVGLYRALLADSTASEGWHDDFLVYSSGWLARNKLPLTLSRAESLLASRSEVFQEMNRLFEIDVPFFTRNAAKATMSERGRFNMTSSGRNRIAFLIAKDFRFIPLTVSLQDYEEWTAPVHTTPLMDLLRAHTLMRTFAPIPHPVFADIPTDFTEYTRLFPVKIAAEIVSSFYRQHCAVTHDGLRIFDDAAVARAINASGVNCLLQDAGTAARYFSSLGFSVSRFFDPSWQNERDLSQCIDRLFAPLSTPDKARGEILLLDSSASLESANPLIKEARRVYFLQRGAQEPPTLLRKNFLETRILFDTFCHSGRIACKEFVRQE